MKLQERLDPVAGLGRELGALERRLRAPRSCRACGAGRSPCTAPDRSSEARPAAGSAPAPPPPSRSGSASIRSQASTSRTSGRRKRAASPANRNGIVRSSNAAATRRASRQPEATITHTPSGRTSPAASRCSISRAAACASARSPVQRQKRTDPPPTPARPASPPRSESAGSGSDVAAGHLACIRDFVASAGGPCRRVRAPAGGRVTRLHRDFVASAGDLPVGHWRGWSATALAARAISGPKRRGRSRTTCSAPGWASMKEGRGIAHRDRRASNRLVAVAGADQVAVLGGQRLDQRAVSQPGVLELVDHHEPEALGQGAPDVGTLAQQPAELDHQVGGVEAAAVAKHPVVAGVEVGELALARAPARVPPRRSPRARLALPSPAADQG